MVVAGLLAVSTTAQAQTATTFVSNTGETGTGPNNEFLAQSFITGANAGGYMISEVELMLGFLPSVDTLVRIRRGDAGGVPHDLVATLTNPATLTLSQLNTFTAPTGTTLAANTTYWITLNEGISVASRAWFEQTSSDGQTGETGWSIGDGYLSRTDETQTWSMSPLSLLIAVRGTAIDATLSELTLEDGDGTFITLSPAFNAATVTYTASVANGIDAVVLTATQNDRNATVAIANDDDTNKPGEAELDLIVGPNTLTVTVTAEDGTTTKTYTITVTREVAQTTNTPATGKPTIEGTAQVDQELTAGQGNIADADGLPATFPGDYTFQWVRVDSDGASNEMYVGSDSITYTPLAADVGKKIKVKVSFTDDGGTTETRTSDAYPSGVGTTVAANTAPTATDSSVTTNEDTAHHFAASEFNFDDTDTSDTLASVTVVTLPTAGALELDGTTVTADQVVAAEDIGKLVFTPAQDANGTGYASFTFKVSDGTDESAQAYTMTIDVTPVNDNDTAQVTGVSVIAGNAQLAVSWTAVDNATGYTVQWKSGGESYDANRQATVTPGSTTSHTIAGLANGTEYTVRVTATRTGAADGPPSAEVTGTPRVPSDSPTVFIEAVEGTVTEGEPARFRVRLSQTWATTVDVHLDGRETERMVSGNTNVSRTFTPTGPGGRVWRIVEIATDDDWREAASELTMRVVPGRGDYTVDETATATVRIEDND